MSNSTGRLFDQIVANAEEAKKSLNLSLTERSIKRKYQSAYDDCDRQKDEAKIKYNNALSNLDRFDINVVIAAKAVVDDAEATQKLIVDSYKELFGDDLV